MKAYKKKILYILFTVIILLNIPFGSFCQTIKDTVNMQPIQFIPKEFHDVKLGYNHSASNKCTPHYPNYEFHLDNEIKINVPEKIIFKKNTSEIKSIIPVCSACMISFRRSAKYNHLLTDILYIRKLDEDVWYSGSVLMADEGIELPPSIEDLAEERKREKEARIAQSYSDDELNEGQSAGHALNVNLMDFVDIPLSSGTYEIYLTFAGLESNHARVEIVFEGEGKVQDTRLINKAEIPDEIEAIEEEELPEI